MQTTIAKAEWNRLLLKTVNYNIYNSFEWGDVSCKRNWSVMRCLYVLDEFNYVMALCQVRKAGPLTVVSIPGGLSFRFQRDGLLALLTGFVKELTQMFSRFAYVRVSQPDRMDPQLYNSFREAGLKKCFQYTSFNHTFHVDLTKEISFTRNCKHNVSRGTKSNLVFSDYDWRCEKRIEEFCLLVKETEDLKGFKVPFSGGQDVWHLLTALNSYAHLFLATLDGKAVSGRIVGVFQDKAFDLAAATNAPGRSCYASYFLMNSILEWLKQKGVGRFDFSGADPLRHKGVFNFKKGFGGDSVVTMGDYEYSEEKWLRWLMNYYVGSKYPVNI